MWYARMKFILIGLFLLLGVLLHLQLGWSAAWYLYAAALLFALMHLFLGNVMLAWRFLRSGRQQQAEKLLRMVWKPDWLVKPHRGYYFFSKGLIALQTKHFEQAEQMLLRGLDGGLQPVRSRALALLNLAHIAFVQDRHQEVRSYLDQIKALSVDDLKLADKVAEMEQALKINNQ